MLRWRRRFWQRTKKKKHTHAHAHTTTLAENTDLIIMWRSSGVRTNTPGEWWVQQLCERRNSKNRLKTQDTYHFKQNKYGYLHTWQRPHDFLELACSCVLRELMSLTWSTGFAKKQHWAKSMQKVECNKRVRCCQHFKDNTASRQQ